MSRHPITRLGLLCGTLAVLGGLSLMKPSDGQAEPVPPKPAKAHETSLTANQEFYAGSPAVVRCAVHSVQSLSETTPLAGADVRIELRDKGGKVYPLYQGKTGRDGAASAEFKVPVVPAGQYTLQVVTRSANGEEKLERTVRVKSDPKILLVTDKPLYQPGQVIHLRALALQAFDLSPIHADLTFEVEDAKGNKVFKYTHRTSDFGVTAADFQLADEVNLGDYRVRAVLGDAQADKTVAVKRYVLPKFKTDVTADKRYYLPKETVKVDLQTDYFFGKPVAGGKVKVAASTFDVQFRQFQTWEGKTDAGGHAKFEIKLPDYFVGQPLQKGDALVRLEITVTDTADHSEVINKTYPVSDQAIRVSLIPEGGRLVPEMENRIYAAAVYPDGSPAACEVKVWIGKRPTDRSPWASLQTNAAGLAEFRLTPKPDQFRQGDWAARPVEMLGGQRQEGGGPRMIFDLFAEAKDKSGNVARAAAEVNSEPLGENILLRLDKAIYRSGDTLQADILTSAGLPTAYLDVIRGGQTLLSRWLEVKDGKAAHKLDLPAELFGTLEVHAYQMLASGEIIRDSRVVYVQPRDELKINVKADKDVYLPGEPGRITFHVTDAAGKPTAAALGVIIVDESVYALQEMQPGLEKVYFTLQEELLKPQAQVVFKPSEQLDTLVVRPELPAEKQQIARVLLTSVKPNVPARWEVAPAVERWRQVQTQMQQIGLALFGYAGQHPFQDYDPAAKKWRFKPGLLQNAVKTTGFVASVLKDPFGKTWTLDDLAKLEKDLTPESLAEVVTLGRIQQLTWVVGNYANNMRAKAFKDGKWILPNTLLADAVKSQGRAGEWLKDAWGEPLRLVRRDKKNEHQTGLDLFDYHELVSAGPDRKFDTADDLRQFAPPTRRTPGGLWFACDPAPQAWGNLGAIPRRGMMNRWMFERAGGMGRGMQPLAAMPQAGPGGGGGVSLDAAMPVKKNGQPGGPDQSGGGSAPTRIREYFPETLLWQPALITDDQGRAELPLAFADSITTWRLSASGSSRGGLLGGVTTPLRVFQDFFVDIDLPVSLTQNDEVAFPVAVYNYLKTPQTVKLELQSESWFELMDPGGLTRSLDLKSGEVTSVKFRIKARRLGQQPLTVKASGSKMSDAVKRSVEIVPDGQKVERVFSDRLTGKVAQTIDIPDNAIPESYKLIVKVYPGIMSQVLEGTEGMLRLPGG